jgi:DNA-binding MarR family transcriptional regulator
LTTIRPQIARLAPLLNELVLTYRRRSGDIPDVLKQAGGLGERHVATLISLAIAGPATVSELGERMGMSTAHASLVVGELARAGLADRDVDERDRRRVIVSLSDAAAPAVAQMRQRHAEPMVRFLRSLGEEEAERFIVDLERLVGLMREG